MLGIVGAQVYIYNQPIVQEFLGCIKPSRIPFQVIGFDDTLLVLQTKRSKIGKLFSTAAHGKVVVLCKGSSGDFFLPVGIATLVIKEASHFKNLFLELSCTVNRKCPCQFRYAHAAVVIHHRSTGFSFFCSDEDYAICTTCSIDGSGGCVFQYIHRFDVCGVDKVQRITSTCAGIIERKSVNHKKRGTSCTHTARPSDADTLSSTRFTTCRSYIYTSYLALQQLLRRIDDSFIELFSTYTFYSAGYIAFALCAITHNNNLGQVS